MRPIISSLLSDVAACGLALLCAGCDVTHSKSSPEAADAEKGAELISELGCGACHTVPGVTGAESNVGPSLERIASRVYIVGMLRNTPENLQFWVQHPQSVVPGNVMPDIPMSDTAAHQITAYLETLR